jgi:hypothetical protein
VKYRDLTRFPFTFYSLPHDFDFYGIHAIPTVYILNSTGETIFQKVGDVDWQSSSLLRKINPPNRAEAR